MKDKSNPDHRLINKIGLRSVLTKFDILPNDEDFTVFFNKHLTRGNRKFILAGDIHPIKGFKHTNVFICTNMYVFKLISIYIHTLIQLFSYFQEII